MTQPDDPRINVLVVDDDEDTSVLLGLHLGRRGWGTMFASGLAQARNALYTADFSALITDMSLPDGSGMSLLANRRPSLRAAVVITGRTGEAQRRESKRVGFDAYVVKPFDCAELVSVLEGLLAPRSETPPGRPIEPAPSVLPFLHQRKRDDTRDSTRALLTGRLATGHLDVEATVMPLIRKRWPFT